MIKKLAGYLLLVGLITAGVLFYKPQGNHVNQTDFTLKVENGEKGVWHGQEITPPTIDLAQAEPATQVLGDADPEAEKRISIDLATQTLSAYQGEDLYMKALVSTGKWGRTPTGEFTIWSKFRSTHMSGGSGTDYYNLPNVPYTMFFSGSGIAASRGFALHGAYWHNNFGHPMSHGCVNMRTVDAQKLFNWADKSAKITIYGQAPG